MNAQIAWLTIVVITGLLGIHHVLRLILHEIKVPEQPEIFVPLTAAQLRHREEVENELGD